MPVSATPARIVAGEEYVEQITAMGSDRDARLAFQNLVLSMVPPGGTVFDFGAGPGIDARLYAERGLTVAAYDVDPKMSEFFAAHCRDLIDAGIVLECCSYRDFLVRKEAEGRGADLVTSNFAPLNLIEDLQPLFAKFHALTAPDGKVLASVLSPYFVGDLKYGWWWRNGWRLYREGRFSVPGVQAPIVRRRLADFAQQSGPYFALKRVFRGLPSSALRHANGVDVSRGLRHAWLRVTTCRFMFLLFEKQDLSKENGSPSAH